MARSLTWAVALLLFSSGAPAQEEESSHGLQPALDATEQALGDIGKLAVIRPEATGTTDDLSGLEAFLVERLSRREKLTIVTPEEIFSKLGPEFAISPEGLAGVAKKFGAGAALFVRVFMSPEKTELHLLMVNDQAKVLVDQSFPIKEIPPGKEPPAPPPPPPEARGPEAGPPEESPKEQPPPEEPPDPYAQRRLALVPRSRMMGGASLGVAGRHVALGFHTPVLIRSDWMVVEGEQPISELQLAQMTGHPDIAKRIEGDISSLKTIRNVGIGMTLGGFVTAGIAFPFVKAEGDKVTTAGVLVGTGLAAGAAGLVMWLLYGPDAGLAETPYPVNHLVTREEAHKMIRSYNQKLEQELKPAPPPAGAPAKGRTVTFRLFGGPLPGGAAAALEWRF